MPPLLANDRGLGVSQRMRPVVLTPRSDPSSSALGGVARPDPVLAPGRLVVKIKNRAVEITQCVEVDEARCYAEIEPFLHVTGELCWTDTTRAPANTSSPLRSRHRSQWPIAQSADSFVLRRRIRARSRHRGPRRGLASRPCAVPAAVQPPRRPFRPPPAPDRHRTLGPAHSLPAPTLARRQSLPH